jgi:DnaK suppressor protein
MAIDADKARQALEAERAGLVHQLKELGAAESGDLDVDLDFGGSFADAAAVTAERTEVLGVVDSLRSQVENIDRALAQIDAGKYGVCIDCGTEINPARLEIRPMSIRCVDCKTKLSA